MSNKDWLIGILFSESGVTSAIEKTMLNSTLLAIEEINQAGGILGKPIRYIHHDPVCSPRRYRELAAQMLSTEGISNIFGGYMSSCRKAVLPEVEAYRGLLFYPTYYEGFEYSPNCFYTGAASNQGAVQLASFLMKEYGSNFLLVGSNYVFPYEYNRVITDLVVQANGQIVDEIYVPIEPEPVDFIPVIKKIRKLKPNAIISTVVGAGAKLLYEAYAADGLDPKNMPIAAIATTEAEIATMKPNVAVGHLTSTPFFETVNTTSARRFVNAYKRRFGASAPVTACAEAAYFQVYLYAKAVAIAGTDEPSVIAKTLGGLEFGAPQGTVRIHPDNHHTALWPRIGKVNAQGKFDVVWESEFRVEPDPYFVVPSFNDWANGVRAVRS